VEINLTDKFTKTIWKKNRDNIIRVVTRSYFLNFLTFPDQCDLFSAAPVELRKKFENTSVFVYRRGVSITTKGKSLVYLGKNRKFYWLCRRFPWLSWQAIFLLAFFWLSWPVTSLIIHKDIGIIFPPQSLSLHWEDWNTFTNFRKCPKKKAIWQAQLNKTYRLQHHIPETLGYLMAYLIPRVT